MALQIDGFSIGPDSSMEDLNTMASLMVNGIAKQPFPIMI